VDPVPGRWIVVATWVTFALFFLTIVPDALGVDAFDDLSAGVALALFLVSLPIWFYAFGLAVVRSARGDDVGVGSLFFLGSSAPSDVRRWMIGALVASLVVAAATAYANPFAVLEPVLPLAFMGLWSARYGTFAARNVTAPARSSRPRAQPGGAR
jgi:hypothetical protein